MFDAFWIAFTRVVIGLVFITSAFGKIQNISSFSDAITRFKFFPSRFSPILSYLFLTGEIVVVVTMLIGVVFLPFGFLLSSLLYLAFSIALSSVVLRKIQTSCNCFGLSEKPVTLFHIVRAAGLMVLSAVSGVMLYLDSTRGSQLGLLGWVVMIMAGGVFSLIWVQLDEIAELFKKISA